MDAEILAGQIKEEAVRMGFDLVGIAEVRPSEHADFYRDWIAAGRHGTMWYLEKPDAVRRRLEPEAVFRSAVVVGLNYYPGEDGKDDATDALIARYAHGRDYHKLMKKKLMALLHFVEDTTGRPLPLSRAFVDTSPVLERELAQRAGLGWFGRNTMLINPQRGSYFFIGSLLLEIELEPDAPFERDHCGTCNACVRACPTGALLGRDANGAPVMDATRCISYLTIENRGPIPLELRPLIGNRIFGCDICQEVCPWNGEKFVQLTRQPSFAHRDTGSTAPQGLIELMQMDEAAWDRFSQGSPVRRAKRAGFLRNVAVALGNVGDENAIPVLTNALSDSDPLVRGHVAWALAQIGAAEPMDALEALQTSESDAFVLTELERALAKLRSKGEVTGSV